MACTKTASRSVRPMLRHHAPSLGSMTMETKYRHMKWSGGASSGRGTVITVVTSGSGIGTSPVGEGGVLAVAEREGLEARRRLEARSELADVHPPGRGGVLFDDLVKCDGARAYPAHHVCRGYDGVDRDEVRGAAEDVG